MNHVTARRTTLRNDAASDYERIHSEIPPKVEASLRAAGVVDWTIWRDGDRLLHRIETVSGYEAMIESIGRHQPVDPAWDEIIAGLLRSEPGDDIILPLVWSMSADENGLPGHPLTEVTLPPRDPPPALAP